MPLIKAFFLTWTHSGGGPHCEILFKMSDQRKGILTRQKQNSYQLTDRRERGREGGGATGRSEKTVSERES